MGRTSRVPGTALSRRPTGRPRIAEGRILRSGWLAVFGLWLCVGGPARAVATFDLGSAPDTVSSGGLEFSNFRFESIFGDVDAEDIVLTIDGPSVTLRGRDGPIAVSDGDHAFFQVSYDVTAGSFPIEGVSLHLDSHTEADHFAAVLASKTVWGRSERDHDEGKGRHGRDDDDWGDDDRDDDRNGHDDLGRRLAKLSTFDVSKHGRSLASRLVEAGFEPQEAISVVDAVLLEAWDEEDEAVWTSLRNDFAVVPEPRSAALLGLGLLGLARVGRRKMAARSRSPGIGASPNAG